MTSPLALSFSICKMAINVDTDFMGSAQVFSRGDYKCLGLPLFLSKIGITVPTSPTEVLRLNVKRR